MRLFVVHASRQGFSGVFSSSPIVFPLAREFFDPFYGVGSARIIYSLNYISILSHLVSLSLFRHAAKGLIGTFIYLFMCLYN